MRNLKSKWALGGAILLLAGFPAGALAQPLPSGDEWTLDESAGSTSAADTAGTNLGLCGMSMPVSEFYNRFVDCPTFGVSGVTNTAAGFDGTDDGLRINNVAYDDFTMTAWIKTTQSVDTVVPAPDCASEPRPCWPNVTAEEGAAIIYGASDAYNGMIPMALINGGHIGFGTGACPGDYSDNFCTWYDTLTGGPAVNTGDWVFVAVTRNETTGEKQLWINGTEVANDFAGGIWSDNEDPYLVLGENPVYGSGGNPINSGGTSTHFDGTIDDVQIFPSVLSGNQIAAVQAEAMRATSTAVSCSPASVVVGQASSCTATVTDTDAGTASTPTGSVSFGSDTSGGSLSNSGSCNLSDTATPGQASCAVSYTPGQVGTGTHTITASYGGDTTHATSSGNTTVTVTTRATSTTVSCTPGSVIVGQASSCTATVTDTDVGTASTPTGSVSFGSDTSGGSFSSSGSCNLSATATPGQASCAVSYTPGQIGTGTHTITANYGGDSTHATSSGNTTVTVTGRSTFTSVHCTAIKLGKTRCSAVVTDTVVPTPTSPTGTVSFTSSSPTGAFTPSSCTLSPTTVRRAQCTVSYRPAPGGQTITATYNGDATHAGSSGSTTVTF